MGRRVPAASGGGDAAHPPGKDRRPGGGRASVALRRHYSGSDAPRALVVAKAVAVPGRDPTAERADHPFSRWSGTARGLLEHRIVGGSSTVASGPREAR